MVNSFFYLLTTHILILDLEPSPALHGDSSSGDNGCKSGKAACLACQCQLAIGFVIATPQSGTKPLSSKPQILFELNYQVHLLNRTLALMTDQLLNYH